MGERGHTVGHTNSTGTLGGSWRPLRELTIVFECIGKRSHTKGDTIGIIHHQGIKWAEMREWSGPPSARTGGGGRTSPPLVQKKKCSVKRHNFVWASKKDPKSRFHALNFEKLVKTNTKTFIFQENVSVHGVGRVLDLPSRSERGGWGFWGPTPGDPPLGGGMSEPSGKLLENWKKKTAETAVKIA